MPVQYYTGVGSREIPDSYYDKLLRIARTMRKRNMKLRSGGATGADTAFQLGADTETEIYLPWNDFNGLSDRNGSHINASKLWNFDKAREIAAMYHPAWHKLSQGVKTLHARNAYQVLGFNLNEPSQVLVCYAKPAGLNRVAGGTNTAVAIARQHNVPVYNIFLDKDYDDLIRVIGD